MGKFNIPYNRIVNSLVPHFLRGSRFLNLLYTVVKPLQVLNISLSEFRDYVYQFIVHDTRVIYFEKRLNDLFDNTLRRITVSNGSLDNQIYIYKKSEGEEETIFFRKSELQPDIYFYKKSETLNLSAFTINIPTDVTDTDLLIIATVNQYLTSAKTFTINRF